MKRANNELPEAKKAKKKEKKHKEKKEKKQKKEKKHKAETEPEELLPEIRDATPLSLGISMLGMSFT
jgi:hypothetical protein